MKIINILHKQADLQDLEALRSSLSQKPRDLLLFELILIGNITIKQILELKVNDLAACLVNSSLPVIQETDLPLPVVTPSIKTAFDLVVQHNEPEPDDYIFKSRKGGKQLSVTSVSRLIRSWLEKGSMQDYKGLHGLRSKFGAIARGNLKEDSGNSSLGALPKVKTTTMKETVYKELLKSIITGIIQPRQKLFPEKIARQMGISTTPVREALNRLEAMGFVVYHPKRGWEVITLTRDNLKEILDLRLLLECEAISRAASNIKPETIRLLEIAQQNYQQIDAGDDHGKSSEANRKFHMLAYRDAGSVMMYNNIVQLWDLVSPYHQLLFRQSMVPKLNLGVNHHSRIVQALKNKDPKEARLWLKKDIVKPAEFIFRLFELYENSRE